MLYKLTASSTDRKFDNLEPVAFMDFSSIDNSEKDLENLLADNLSGVLFEDARYMPIHQSRAWQKEADIYALDKRGNLIIFELKIANADKDAVQQVLRYAEAAGQWGYDVLQEKWCAYVDDNNTSSDALARAHKKAFDIERELGAREFNSNQHLIIVGSAADTGLINAVDYWKTRGLSIQFLPYRVYEFGKEKYFEFFSDPYDKHRNPADEKGVLFDTNRSYDEDAIWYMLEKERVAAFGDSSRFVGHVFPGDTVFFSHKGFGLVAAAKVRGDVKSDKAKDALYRDVEFLTAIPRKDDELPAMPFKKVTEIVGKGFYWAKTTKSPYLTKGESDKLVQELRKYLEVKK